MPTLFDAIMREAGAGLGLGEMVLEEGYALIGVDDVAVSVQYLEEADQALLYAEVAPLPEEGREALYAALLEGQSFFRDTAGATLSISRELGAVFLQIVQPLRLLDAASFLTLLEHFVHVVQYWRKVCTAGEDAGGTPAAAEDAPGVPDAGAFLLRV